MGAARYSAVRFDYEGDPNGVEIRGVSYLVEAGPSAYLLDFTAPPNAYQPFSAVIQRSIASLELP